MKLAIAIALALLPLAGQISQYPASSGGGAPSGAAGGDLGGTYPNPTVTSGAHITNSSIPNSGLVNTGTTVNGQSCVLGTTCTVPAVTSVGFTGGLLSIATPTTTPAITVAGTSGGIPYFSGASTWASSAALTAHGVVIGGGAGTTPASTSAGTAGQVLTSNGASADPTYQAGGLTLLEQHTASASASLSFTSWYSSAYDEYRIEFVNVVPGTTNTDLVLRWSTNGGSSYDSSAIYDKTQSYSFASNTGGADGQTNQTGCGMFGAITNSANYGVSGPVMLYSPGSTTVYKNYVADFVTFQVGANALARTTVACSYKNASAVNAFQVTPSSGTIASGTIRVYGLAK